MPPSVPLKLVLAMALGGGIVVSLVSRPPRRAIAGGELRRLIGAAVALYVVGGAATLTHHSVLAGLVYAAGISTCALAAWLSRGSDSEGPPGGEEPLDERPPPEPDGVPGPSSPEWARFEAQFREYAAGQRDRVGVR